MYSMADSNPCSPVAVASVGWDTCRTCTVRVVGATKADADELGSKRRKWGTVVGLEGKRTQL